MMFIAKESSMMLRVSMIMTNNSVHNSVSRWIRNRGYARQAINMESPNDIEYRGWSVNRLHRSRSPTQNGSGVTREQCAKFPHNCFSAAFAAIPRFQRSTFSFVTANIKCWRKKGRKLALTIYYCMLNACNALATFEWYSLNNRKFYQVIQDKIREH